MTSAAETELRDSYIDLIKRAVTNYAYLGGSSSIETFDCLSSYDKRQSRWNMDARARPMTLLSKGQLDLIEKCALKIEEMNVPGDYIEAGVWRGGAIIFMRALMKAYGIEQRKIIAADSFSGIPQNQVFRHDPVDNWVDRWEASLDEVNGNIARFGLLDDRIEMLSGLFSDSLPSLSGRSFALIRLDSDAHDSVMASLEHLYPALSPGGIIIVDDWHLVGCRFAVNAYRKKHNISDEICVEAGNGYWTKTSA